MACSRREQQQLLAESTAGRGDHVARHHVLVCTRSTERRGLEGLTDYVATDSDTAAAVQVNADIVFVGYGIEAPEYNWDDYKGADMHGKSAVDAGE